MASISAEQGISLLKDPKFSDMTVVCGEHIFRVHKAIICSAFPFFAKCLESAFKESHTSTVTIGETEPFTLGLALIYIYTKGYDIGDARNVWVNVKDATEAQSQRFSTTINSLLVYELAGRLLMPEMQKYASEKFKSNLNGHKWDVKKLKEEGTMYADLCDVLKQVYQRLPEDDTDIRVQATYYAARLAYASTSSTVQLADLLNEFEPVAFGVYKPTLQNKRK